MTASPSLTAELRTEVLSLQDDLRTRLPFLQDHERNWREEHDEALSLGRTAASWQEWSEERITQAAVAWVLTTVFVRFCEDNGLVAPVWISGPAHRRQEALDAQSQFLREEARKNADVTDREWLTQAIAHLSELPATAALVDERSALWLVTPSGDAAARLLAFWRERDESGVQRRDLADPGLETRFLGDLYQDLSEEAKSRYALLQTPVFVEEFILDRTLEPALRERPLDGFRMIDPTCGSGHFLLGAFARLLDRWHRVAPGLDERERVQRALDAVHGVDLNPFAVAITRFRLTVAALKASGMTSLEDAPAFRYHVAVGDSLLHGLDQGELDLGVELGADQSLAGFGYATEDVDALRTILENGRYDCVVGNPPYITVKDKALNAAYRAAYKYCKGKYALTVPFMERFFALAVPGPKAGWVGQITSNSFMKREFGAPLIENFFPRKDLALIADTSGAYVPGHGTPTVIVVGRNQGPVASTVRAVLGVRGEPGRPDDPARGKVWSAIVEHVNEPGYSDEWVTIADLDRELLLTHPWSLTGGGAVQLMQALGRAKRRLLNTLTKRIGFFGIMGSDPSMIVTEGYSKRKGLEPSGLMPLVRGEDVRDFGANAQDLCWFPYDDAHVRQGLNDFPDWTRHLWPLRTELGNRPTFSGGTYFRDGRPWWEWHQLPKDDGAAQLSILYANVATHNHVVLDRGGNAFTPHASLIKLPEGASEDDHLALLGVLNSSTACFWLKQNSHNKGSTVDSKGARQTQVPWEDFYEFTGTTLQDFPLPDTLPLVRGRLLDGLGQSLSWLSPRAVCERDLPTRELLDDGRRRWERVREEMVSIQEELDWDTYCIYGLTESDLSHEHEEELGPLLELPSPDDIAGVRDVSENPFPGSDWHPRLRLGERAFEIVLARRIAAGEKESAWFDRHGSTPVTELPTHWPETYRDLVETRIKLIESHPYLRLLERPEHKRRWATESWEKQEERALRSWLLDRLEDGRFWFDAAGRPTPRSIAHLADDASHDSDFVAVLALWEGRPDVPVVQSLQRLLPDEAVPYLATFRYKDSGLRKRAAWEHTWNLQRREDSGTYRVELDGPIPVPPKYTSADFVRKEYWAHRGKLDVPKERFVLYPAAGRDTDLTPVLGWAGWNHAQQALALAQLIQQREAEGWDDERLVPLVAGLAELQPWVSQWHHEPDPFYGGVSPAEFFHEQLENRARQVGKTLAQLTAWRPEQTRRGRSRMAAGET